MTGAEMTGAEMTGDIRVGLAQWTPGSGRTVASAPRHRDLVSSPELLVADLAVDHELAAAAAASSVLWSAPSLRRTEDVS
jgi:hypothetical protein